jgi:hypothetical protein
MGSHPSLTPAQDAAARVIAASQARMKEIAGTDPMLRRRSETICAVQCAFIETASTAIDAGAEPVELITTASLAIGSLVAQAVRLVTTDAPPADRLRLAEIILSQAGVHGIELLIRCDHEAGLRIGEVVPAEAGGHA